MPPTFGKRDESSITTNPCGTKKKIAATTHRTSVTGPALADVARCRRPSTATRFIRTRSLSLSARTSWTGCEVVRVVSVVISLEKRDKNKCARVGAILADREENEQIQAVGVSLIGLVEVAVIAAGHKLAHRVAAFFLEETAEDLDGLVQTKRISVAADHVDLAFELRREMGPVLFEDQPDVVIPPVFQNLLIQFARFAVEHLHRTTIFAARTPDPLKRGQLAAVFAGNHFLPRELFDADDKFAAHPHQLFRQAVTLAVGVVGGARRRVNTGEAAQINRVGRS